MDGGGDLEGVDVRVRQGHREDCPGRAREEDPLSGLLGGVVVLMALVGILALMVSGARTGTRGNFKDRVNALGSPSGAVPLFILGTLAIGQLLAFAGAARGLTATAGAVVGFASGALIASSVYTTVLALVGVVAGLVSAIQFVGSGAVVYGTDSVVFRVALMGLITMFFVLGSGLGLMTFRSARTFAFGHGRGLAFFGLIDMAQFLASPAGVDLLDLDAKPALVLVTVGCAVAAAAGVFAGQFTLFVIGAGVTAINVLLPLVGWTPTAPGSPAAVTVSGYFVTACVTFGLARFVTTRVFGKVRR